MRRGRPGGNNGAARPTAAGSQPREDAARQPREWTSQAVASLAVSTQLAGLAHLALVPHVTCPEHGELVEASPAGGRGVVVAAG